MGHRLIHKRTMQKTFFALALMAMTLSIFAHLSPIWAANQNGTQITICSAFGTQTILIDENGNEIPQSPKLRTCSLCFMTGLSVHIPDSPLSLAPRDVTLSRFNIHDLYSAQVAQPPLPQQTQPRAPPVSS